MAVKKKVSVKFSQRASVKAMVNGFWNENPVFRMVLGICSTLAVTNRINNAIAMSLGVTFVLICSSWIISLLRNVIPRQVRMIVYTIIIGTFVIFVDKYLQAYFPVISKQMGPYVGLIITNCIIMGRLEAFSCSNKPWLSVMDAIGCGAGYSLLLILIALVREILGFGSLFGIQLFANWTNWVIMVMAPGAFLVLGVFIWILRGIQGPVEN